MLGRLASWLRIAGANVSYARDADGERLLKQAVRDDAVLITRDEELFLKAKGYVRAVFVESDETRAQLRQVAAELRLKLKPGETVCAHCGGALKRIGKSEAEGKVFPRVFRAHRVFRRCSGCGQVYWKGSHWRGIKRVLKNRG